jgi:hypothetical protein
MSGVLKGAPSVKYDRVERDLSWAFLRDQRDTPIARFDLSQT